MADLTSWHTCRRRAGGRPHAEEQSADPMLHHTHRVCARQNDGRTEPYAESWVVLQKGVKCAPKRESLVWRRWQSVTPALNAGLHAGQALCDTPAACAVV